MKQKYAVSIDREKSRITIREFAELEKDEYSLLCQEEYSADLLEQASAKGLGALVTGLRTVNMYPSGIFAEKIALAVQELLRDESAEGQDLFFNDIDAIGEAEEVDLEEEDDESEEDGDYDDLLEGDADDGDDDLDEAGGSATGAVDGDEEENEDPLD